MEEFNKLTALNEVKWAGKIGYGKFFDLTFVYGDITFTNINVLSTPSFQKIQ